MATHRNVLIQGEDGVVLSGGFFIPDGLGQHPALVICHGMPAAAQVAGTGSATIDDGISYPDLASVCAERGFATLIFNFRGTGGSGGNFHPLGWAKDLETVLAWVVDQTEVDRDRVSVLGSSMGALVGVCVAAQNRTVAALVSFASPARPRWTRTPEEMVQHGRDMGIIRDSAFPPSVEAWWREFEALDPLRAIKDIAPRPLLLIHGLSDDVVDPSEAAALFAQAGEPKEIIMLPGVTHRFRSEPTAIERALSWLEATLES